MKLTRTIKIATLLLCLVSAISPAQEQPGAPNDLDKQFVPDKNSIFNSESKAGEDNSSSSDMFFKNVIKFNLAMLPRSIAAFYYERRLSDQISLEAGLGRCYGKDRILSLSSEVSPVSNNNASAIGLYDLMQQADFNGGSLFASFSFRINASSYYDWDLTPYFEINTRYYTNKLKLNSMADPTYDHLAGTPEVTIKNSSINLIYGWQFFTDGKINTSHDFYMGIGMRNTSYDKFTKEQITDPYGETYNLYTKTSEREKGIGVSFICGYAFGFGF